MSKPKEPNASKPVAKKVVIRKKASGNANAKLSLNKKSASSEAGQKFEEQIARLYELLGYDVTRNISVGNQQVDLVAERFLPGLGRARLFIECKYKSADSVSNQDIHDLQTTFNALRTRGRFTNAVLVTNTRFSKDARGAAEAEGASAPIHLRTVAQLEDELLNLSDSLSTYVVNYQGSDIAKTYVELAGVGNLPYSESGHIEELDAEIISWIGQKKKGLITILADFGSGKSTLMRHLKYKLCLAKLEPTAKTAPIPMFFALRELRNFGTLDEYIEYVLREEFRKAVPISVFWRLLRRGDMVVLLDGFDEIDSSSDVNRRRAAFLRLSPLITQNPGVTIITCRPQFFVSIEEYNSLLVEIESSQPRPLLSTIIPDEASVSGFLNQLAEVNRSLRGRFVNGQRFDSLASDAFGKIKLNPLSDRRIEIYLDHLDVRFRKELGVDSKFVLDFLRKVYDLSDLIKRPLLLEMVMETLFTRRLDIKDKDAHVNTARLYEIYTSVKLEIEASDQKGRLLLSSDERREFAELLAVEMYSRSTAEISYMDLLESVQTRQLHSSTLRQILLTETPEAVATDVRLCSFLTLNEKGQYYFVHKSFMEFFVARSIIYEIDRDGNLALLASILPSAILHFIGSFLALDQRLRDILSQRVNLSTNQGLERGNIKANFLGALLHGGINLSSQYFSGVAVRNMSFPAVHLRWFRLSECSFHDTNLSMLFMKECTVDQLSLNHCGIDKIDLESSSFNSQVTECRVRQLRTVDSTAVLDCAGLYIDVWTSSQGSIEIGGSAFVGSAILSSVRLQLRSSMGNLVFRAAEFTECTIETSWRVDDDVVDWRAASFKKCKLRGLSSRGLIGLKHGASGASVSVIDNKIQECEGVLLYSGIDIELTQLIGPVFWLDKVAIVNIEKYFIDAGARQAAEESIRSRLDDESVKSFNTLVMDISRQRAEIAHRLQPSSGPTIDR